MFPKLDPPSLHLRAYSDASFATATNSSQTGIVVFLAEKYEDFHFIHWASTFNEGLDKALKTDKVVHKTEERIARGDNEYLPWKCSL